MEYIVFSRIFGRRQNMNKTVVLVGTFDTKGKEYEYVKRLLEELGIHVLTVNIGIFPGSFEGDITADEVAGLGGSSLSRIVYDNDRGAATAVMSRGLSHLLPELYEKGFLDGVLSMGGSGGTAMATAGMRALPMGIPKIMISTMAGGNVSPYVGTSDIIMIPSIVDIAGLNTISRTVFRRGVMIMAGLLGCSGTLKPDTCPSRPAIAATMYGVTTPCVTYAKDYLEQKGYEVIVFHASGNGGRMMEQLIRQGAFCGVLDITTTEWCDELYGGIMAAGPHRSEAAADCNIPQVVSVGAMDLVTFGPPETVPACCQDRKLYPHNPMITVMRTTAEENRELGHVLAEKLNRSRGNTILILPLRGVSAMDAEGKAFFGPEEDQALFDTLRSQIDREKVGLAELDCHINDRGFGITAAELLIHLMNRSAGQ